MTTRTYPYTAWILQPSFKPVQVDIVRPYGQGNFYDMTASAKVYALNDLFATKAEVIARGKARLMEQEEAINKKMAAVAKRRAALYKAERTE